MNPPKHLPTGCPNSIPDPAKRLQALVNARASLRDRILQAQDEIGIIDEEIAQCSASVKRAQVVEDWG